MIPKSISFIYYHNDGKHREFFFVLLGYAAGLISWAAVFNPLLWISVAGVIGVILANNYKENGQIAALHYLSAALFAVPLVITGWSLYLLIPLVAAGVTKLAGYGHWLLAFETVLLLTTLILTI